MEFGYLEAYRSAAAYQSLRSLHILIYSGLLLVIPGCAYSSTTPELNAVWALLFM